MTMEGFIESARFSGSSSSDSMPIIPGTVNSKDTNITDSLKGTSHTNDSISMSATLRPYPHPAQVAMMWILPMLMVSLNILVFIVAPRMKMRRPGTAYGMISLAAADFSLGIVHIIRMSYNTYSDYELQAQNPVCIIDGYGQALFASISIATLTFMNIDRLLTLAFPLHYSRYFTKRRVITVHVVIWITMITLLAPTTTGVSGTSIKYYDHAFMCVPDWAGNLAYNLVVLALVEVIPTVVIVVCFCGIFYFARTKDKQLKGGSARMQVHHGGNNSAENSQWKRDMKIFKTLAIMTFGFYIAWSPYFVTVAIPEMITGRSLHTITDFLTPWLGASNSFWNPLIYIPTMRPFYKATVGLLKMLPCARYRCVRMEDGVDGKALSSSGANSGGTATTGVSNSAMEQNHREDNHQV